MRSHPSPSHFSDILIARTLRMIEDQGPLEDGEAMREAFRTRSGREERLLERARLLSKRIRLDDELARWREIAIFVWLGLAILVFAMAYGIAAALLGGSRSLNVVLAFFGVLGVHALTLLLWLLSLGLSALSKNIGGGRISLGNLFLTLVARIPVDRGPYSLMLARSATELFRHSRLAPWAFGFISHSIWAASFVLVLGALWFGFSFREYRLTWETTILHADFFIRFVQITGSLPSLAGFPVPDTSTLLNPVAAGSDQRAWALWLMGCTFVYGFLVRLFLACICWVKWQHGKRSVGLDTSAPYFRKILARFDQMETSDITDREQRSKPGGRPEPCGKEAYLASPALIGFELPEEFTWPPLELDLPPALALNERISGSSQERKSILEKLAQLHPSRLLVACNLSSTPDRGTERFLREVLFSAGQCALLLLNHAEGSDKDMKRWRAWLVDTNMRGIMIFSDSAQASHWLAKADKEM